MRVRAALLVVLAALLIAAASATAAPPYPQLPVMPAHSARAFGDSVGINARLTHLDTSYGDFDTIRARLRELGVRYISDTVCPDCEYQIDRLQRLAAVGIRANLAVGWLAGGTATIAPGVQALRTRLRDSVVSISTVNEPDVSGDPQWIAHTRAFQAEVHRQVEASPTLRNLPVIGPSLVDLGARAALGDLSAHLDRGNLHPYSGGLPPLGNLENERRLMANVSRNKPLVITEVGYHTDMAHTGPHRPASERAVATYTPRIALEAFRFGIERTYFYTLADLWSAQEAKTRGLSASENSFGLLRSNLAPKPSFLALRNFLRAVNGDSAPVASPGGLRVALEGGGPDVRRLLLRSADGSYALVLWRTVSVWDRNALRDLTPAPVPVDVVMGDPVSLARRFDPVVSDLERQRWTGPRRIRVDLAGDPVVLRLVPAGSGRRGTLGERGRGRCAARRKNRAAEGPKRRARGRPVATWSRACAKKRRR